jgi:hypothetical protein
MLYYSDTTHPSQGKTKDAEYVMASTILVSNITVNAQCSGSIFVDVMLMFQGNTALLAADIDA